VSEVTVISALYRVLNLDDLAHLDLQISTDGLDGQDGLLSPREVREPLEIVFH